MISKLFKGAMIFLLVFVSFNIIPFKSAKAFLNTVYVATDGDDDNDGSSPTFIGGTTGPKQTVASALDMVNSGGTIIVGPGSYGEDVVITKSVNLHSTANTYDVDLAEQTVFTGYSSITINNDVDNVTIRGFIFSAILSEGNIINIGSAGDNTVIEYNEFTTSNGINAIISEAPSASTGLIIRNNNFEELSVGSIGIYISGYPGLNILDNTFTNINLQAIVVAGSSNILISGNTINETTGVTAAGIGLGASSGQIFNNNITNGEIQVSTNGLINNVYITENSISNTTTTHMAAIYATGNAGNKIIVNHNNFLNSINGIINDGTGTINGRYNWWGSATGPFNEGTNPSGTGGIVSSGVNFIPFSLSWGWNTSIIGQGNVILTSYGPFLLRAIKRVNGKIFTSISLDAINWIDLGSSAQIAVGDPAYHYFTGNSTCYQVVRGSNNKVYLSYLNGPFGWTQWVEVGSGAVNNIAISELGGKLYIVYRGNSGMFYYKYSADGITWSGLKALDKGKGNATLNNYNNRLILSLQGNSGYYYTKSTTNGSTWTALKKAINIASDIKSTEFQGKLYQSVRTYNDKIYTRSTSDGVNWSAWNNGDQGIDNPTLVGTTNYLYQFKRGNSKTVYFRISPNGYNWSYWYSTGIISQSDYSAHAISDEVVQSYRYINQYIHTSVGKAMGVD